MALTAWRIRALGAGLGAVLLATSWLAPRLPLAILPAISMLWLLLLAALVVLALRVLRTWVGRGGAAVLGVLGVAVPVVLTGIQWSGTLGIHLPCRRNWGWPPSYLLRSSPMGAVTFDIGGARVKVCYGRPAARGRRMIGGKHVPFGQLWRTGANEPTTIRSTAAITVAGIPLARGVFSLYTIPGPETWEIILNQATSQWGLESEYTDLVRAREIGRTVVTRERLPGYVETFTIHTTPQSGGSADLVLEWETTRVQLPVSAP